MNVLQKRNRSIPDGNETAAVLFFLLFIFLKQFYLFLQGDGGGGCMSVRLFFYAVM